MPAAEASEDWRAWDDWSKARLAWMLEARPEQKAPAGDYLAWLFLGGRGGGKTRAGAEDVSDYCRRHPRCRVALVAPTFAGVRDTMVEGESGLLRVLPPSALRGGSPDSAWNRSMGELRLSNGAQLQAYSSEKPGRLRGPQHHRAWIDEPAELQDAAEGDALDTTWNNLMLGLRLGQSPQAVVTGTPKPVMLLKQLVVRPDVRTTRATTYDNLANLSPQFRERVLARYEGTRLGRQELLAELLEDVEGALWTHEMIDAQRITGRSPLDMADEMLRCVVGVDPSFTSHKGSDECGIVVAGKGHDGRCYVLDDRSTVASPAAWARRAVDAYREFRADKIVAEVNYGGEMVVETIRNVDPSARVVSVLASRGKRQRAEPVAALYEQGMVSHVGSFPRLEDEMASWSPESGGSPDRMDALVWAVSALGIYGRQGDAFAKAWERMAERKPAEQGRPALAGPPSSGIDRLPQFLGL